MTWTIENGALIRRLREKAGLSQRGLAKRINRSASWISTIETGKARPSLTSLQEIADSLQIPITHLLGEEIDVISPELRDVMQRPLVQELLKHVAPLNDEQVHCLIRIADTLNE